MSPRRPIPAAPLGIVLLLAGLAPWASTQEPPSAAPLRFGDPADADATTFFPDADPDPAIPTPDALLGQTHGSRLARPDEVVAALTTWAGLSERMTLRTTGHSHEGRPLLAATITSAENHARLARIREDVQALADPRGLEDVEAEAILERSPAVAFLGYSIHGDEVSGTDASLAVVHHLIADRSAATRRLLERLVIVVDPCMNPDGRARLVGMVEQMTGYATVLDDEALQRGRWPWGRGNHYLFDLNRDWMTGTHPETRARWAALRDLPPQLFVDAHEMGALDTFLFYPQSQPHNPFLPATLDAWHQVFASDMAAAFDAHGWSYYTREWADGWGPYYSDAWGSLRGAVGMLYEQAGIFGFPLRNRAGQVVHYRDTVRHQAVASLANLTTLAAHRREVLADFLAASRAAVDTDAPGHERMLAIRPGRNADRERALLSLLVGQDIEVRRIGEALEVTRVETTLGERHDTLSLPAGSWLVPAAQPHGAQVLAYLAFDVRLDDATVHREREDLERGEGTNLYDATAWSLPLLFDLDALWCDAPDALPGGPVEIVRPPVGTVIADPLAPAPVAWVVDGDDDVALRFAVAALEDGLVAVVGDEPFVRGGRSHPRGSIVLRAADNPADLAARVAELAAATGAAVHAVSTGRAAGDDPDLGGGHFTQLRRPRVAMLGNLPVEPDTFGHLWHVLDARLGLPVSVLDAGLPGSADLRRYSVIVVPPAWGDVLGPWGDVLAEWVADGGTLIAVGSSAAAVAAHGGLSAVVRRRDALDDLEAYRLAALREAAAREVQVDVAALWGDATAGGDRSIAAEGTPTDADGPQEDADSVGPHLAGLVDDDAARQDAWERGFAPAGVVLRGLVDERSWLTSGCVAELPVLVSGSHVLQARPPVRAAVRLAGAERLRLSGLLWPEARDRLAHGAWLTRERHGSGQMILFADVPGYRGWFLSGARLFGNAVVLGPGCGADPAPPR